MRINGLIILTMTILVGVSSTVSAQTTAFTYQGKLNVGGSPASGTYDFTFKLFTASTAGSQVGTDVTVEDVSVVNGIFTVTIDFGSSPFTTAGGNFLDISVRPGASSDGFTPLSPRQPITSSPYSVQTIRASSAALADNANQLGGVNADQFVQTTDPRMSDARTPLPGSNDYIQTGGTYQPSANLNIGGYAYIGGSAFIAGGLNTSATVSGGVVNATTQYNLNGNRILSNAGFNNVILGVGAGQGNSGGANTFVGSSAGNANNSGDYNTFVGVDSGLSNTAGHRNAFVGSVAGRSNTTGARNSFFGTDAGFSNTTGSDNTFAGMEAGWGNTTGGANAFFGRAAGFSNTSGIRNTFAGYEAGRSNTVANFNAFFGGFAGHSNTEGGANSFFGDSAGFANTTGFSNTFLGRSAGIANTTGNLNAFTGVSAGANNTIGSENSFYGPAAGLANTEGNLNSFFGRFAGRMNNLGSSNSFFGALAGDANTTGFQNAFFGYDSGTLVTTGSQNSFFGYRAGQNVVDGTLNTLIGANTRVSTTNPGITNATAIGANTTVNESNALVLGSNVNVGIGTSSPHAKLHVNGGHVFIAGSNGLILRAPNGLCWLVTITDPGALSTSVIACP